MDKVKVLFLAANPAGTQPLQLDEEIRQITAKVRASEHRDSLELVSRWAVRPDDLLQALLEEKPHIVHFSGHGRSATEPGLRGAPDNLRRDLGVESSPPAAALVLLDNQGHPKPVSQEALVHVFKTLKDNVRVVLLNACWTRPQAEAIARTIDYTIGMNRAVGDEAAIVFAASFYRAIGFGRSAREAFELGKAALLLEGIPEAETPELFIREGIEAPDVTLISPTPATAQDVVQPGPARKGGVPSPLPAMDRLAFVK